MDKPQANHTSISESVEQEKDIVNNINFFISTIETNNRDNFVSLEMKDEKEESKLEIINFTYDTFLNRLNFYMNNISTFYPRFDDFEFLKEYIGRIFILVNPNLLWNCNEEQKKMILEKSLDSAFENNEIKQRFYKLLKEYMSDNMVQKVRELSTKHPKANEIQELADGIMKRLPKDEVIDFGND